MKRGYLIWPLFLTLLFVSVLALFAISHRTSLEQPYSVSSLATKFEEVPKLMLPVLAQSLGRDQASYHIIKKEDYFRARTVSQGFETEFRDDSVRFSRNSQSVTMSLIGEGELEQTNVLSNKIEYKRENIVEWYVNSPLGMEQGFTINSAPEAKKLSENVVLHIGLEMNGDIRPEQSKDGNSINFVSSDQLDEVFSYGGLFAYDSTGKELPSEMNLFDNRIEILVDDKGAEYPIVIDPFIEIQEIFPSDVNPVDVSWQFGGTVSISGNTALVGAIHADGFRGQAYIFNKNINTGFWSETQILTASNAGDFFGNCVHIDGNTAIVGSLNIFSALQGDAYIFERDTMTNMWIEVDNLAGSTGAPGDFYGISCSVEESSGIAMVGANLAFAGEGRVYIYERDMANMWNEVQVLIPSGGVPLLQFGLKLNFQNDTAAVGAPGRIDSMPLVDGEVYIYERDMFGMWNEHQILTGADSMAGDSFGVDVDFDGDNMVIGASQFNMDQGKAYIFEKDEMGLWHEVQTMIATNPVMGEFFGSNVSISEDTAIVSASLLITSPGRVFVYERDSMGFWPEVQELTASNGMPGDEFGIEVSLDGNTLIVGAAGVDGAAGNFTGAAYLYDNPQPVVRNVPTLNGWVLLLLAVLLGVISALVIRKSRYNNYSA